MSALSETENRTASFDMSRFRATGETAIVMFLRAARRSDRAIALNSDSGRSVMKLQPLAPHIKHWSSPELAAHVISKALMNEEEKTGVYYDEKGQAMQASTLVRDPGFTARVVAETRALLATLPIKEAIKFR